MIYFRADANQNIGMGHIMRCLSLADAASQYDQDIIFVLADECVKKVVEDRGFKTIILHSNYQLLDDELDKWPHEKPDYLIVDSYYVTESYFASLKAMLGDGKLIYIDDLAKFPYQVDYLINYNAFGPHLNYHKLYSDSKISEPVFILGTTYVPLRKEFQNTDIKEQPEIVKNVLISTGGSDLKHVALSIVKTNPKDYCYHILIGALNKDKNEIYSIVENNEHIIIHENVINMKSLIESMDIVISAAGSTTYEVSACGVPLITYSVADNQIPGAVAFKEDGIAEYIGDIRNDKNFVEKIMLKIKELSGNHAKRIAIGNKMQKMVDGYGADRIIKIIIDKA